MERRDPFHMHEDSRARAGIARVLAQVQLHAVARDLTIEREILAEPMLPIDRESEEALIDSIAFSTEKIRKIGIAGLELDHGLRLLLFIIWVVPAQAGTHIHKACESRDQR